MKKNIYKKGFTLLEALVAISILMVAVAAPITIAQKGLSSAVYSKDQMIASYLAQDVIEYIKNLRDFTTINDDDFNWRGMEFVQECLLIDPSDLGCEVDTISGEMTRATPSPERLYRDNNGFYVYSPEGLEETKFSRVVKVIQDPEETNDNDRALIEVTVNWNNGGESNNLVVRALIFNY
jgi:Tfp pilus assembly protein PilV